MIRQDLAQLYITENMTLDGKGVDVTYYGRRLVEVKFLSTLVMVFRFFIGLVLLLWLCVADL